MKIKGMRLVGRDGELWLYSDGINGVLFDSQRNTKSKIQPLQVFFKWGNFEPIDIKPKVHNIKR